MAKKTAKKTVKKAVNSSVEKLDKKQLEKVIGGTEPPKKTVSIQDEGKGFSSLIR